MASNLPTEIVRFGPLILGIASAGAALAAT
jgi:hypothetical protein